MSGAFKTPTLGFAFILIASLAISPAHAVVYTVGSPVGPGQCTHGTVQAAIDAAAASSGPDTIRVTQATYTAQRLVVNDTSDLSIEGGFLGCTTTVHANTSILDGQGANPPGPVIRHLGASRLTLSDLTIRNGVAMGANATSTLGGGVSSTGTGAVTVQRSVIHSNRATNGGGMAVLGSFGSQKEVNLISVGFNSNQALINGGGLHASQSDIQISGESSYFAGNHADGTDNGGGGALFALGCNVTVRFEGSGPTVQFMDNNWTESHGGAIYFGQLGPGPRYLWLTNRYRDRPLAIVNNGATRFGGAIYVRASATGTGNGNAAAAMLFNTVVSNNHASEGGAFYLYGNGTDAVGDSSLSMVAGLAGAECPAQLRCNRVDDNQTALSSTVSVNQAGNQGRASFSIYRGHMVNNQSPNGSLIGGNGYMGADSSVLANNMIGNAPLAFAVSSELRIENSTIAGNIGVTPQVFQVLLSPGALRLHNSIIFQPGVATQLAATGATASLRNLLVNNDHGIANPASFNVQQTFDPLFVNPGQGDFRPQLGSQAVNRWSPGGGVNVPTIDLLGASRPAPPTDSPTPYDFGAYEYGAVIDTIFFDGFDSN